MKVNNLWPLADFGDKASTSSGFLRPHFQNSFPETNFCFLPETLGIDQLTCWARVISDRQTNMQTDTATYRLNRPPRLILRVPKR